MPNFCNATPYLLYQLRGVTNEVGVEVEVEGRNLPEKAPDGWRAVADGSLRGEALEYVFAGPVHRRFVLHRLKALEELLTTPPTEVDLSYRCSVHVHINVQQLTMTQIMCIICLYLIFEDMLIDYCGPTRKGNLFCLAASDADYIITNLVNFVSVQAGNFLNTGGNQVRYGALNIDALRKYGSLEFRSFRGTICAEEIHEWVEILLRLKDCALTYDNPKAIIEEFSSFGPMTLLNKTFGPYAEMLRSVSDADIIDSMWRIQPIAYGNNWPLPKKTSKASSSPDWASVQEALDELVEGID